ncbi:carbohydrate ABC transporter permease [Reinekea blandensis]|uniref:ABC transporter, membrane spanning protein (Sugar) n=1 Tax=Reinekea blandensis MED297 TaxID=314283 RepID=A4BAU6_9GAMM|nr:carbohydrate ABC transporter permease [Reinekea blandensis]EAR10559.1 ABC transporter, membrane spanning protein (sugar) [Reinekea sp. MED297] [Reinekea blandensis MED297]
MSTLVFSKSNRKDAAMTDVPWKRYLNRVLWYATLLGVSVPFVFPFIWMVSGSLKSQSEITAFPPTIIPETFRWENYVEIFQYQPFAQQYFNSLYIAVVVTISIMFVASLAGYAFAKIKFKGANLVFLLLLSGLMMPEEVTIIPNFFAMSTLNLMNSHVPLILLPVFGSQGIIATFLMRQFFMSIPNEVEEAGIMDGLSRFGVFWRIALPLSGPALAAVAILSFLHSWNLLLEPLVFVSDLDKFTVPLALNNFSDAYGLPLWHLQMAATSLAVIPVLLIYVIAQRHIVQSFAMTGVKG